MPALPNIKHKLLEGTSSPYLSPHIHKPRAMLKVLSSDLLGHAKPILGFFRRSLGIATLQCWGRIVQSDYRTERIFLMHGDPMRVSVLQE
jgi:hypothetical protein